MEKNYRQIYMNTLCCKHAEDVPAFAPPYKASVGFMDAHEKGPTGGGYDGFGIWWDVTPEGPIPSSRTFMLEDISDWETVVKFPDVDAIDWKAKSEKDMPRIDRDKQVLEYGMGNAHFERLAALMGFEGALCAMVEDPGAVKAYMEAFTDYRIKCIRKIAEYYHPDVICSYDDVAHLRGTFMSRSAYQELIKPYHIAVNDECKSLGIIPIQHCCGKAESLVEDFIDEGAQCWTSVQPCNDIVGLLEKYGDRISLCGGFDTDALTARSVITQESIREEARKAIDKYAVRGSYILGNLSFFAANGMTKMEMMGIAVDETLRYGEAHYR